VLLLVGAAVDMVAIRGHLETLARTELADRNWTITVPADAADTFEQPGFQ
jgi:hypothetical protein